MALRTPPTNMILKPVARPWQSMRTAPPATICSDEWKIRFFGSTTNPAAADNADPDGDGVPNWMEFLAGTDPTSALSKFQLTGAVSTRQQRTNPDAIELAHGPGTRLRRAMEGQPGCRDVADAVHHIWNRLRHQLSRISIRPPPPAITGSMSCPEPTRFI